VKRKPPATVAWLADNSTPILNGTETELNTELHAGCLCTDTTSMILVHLQTRRPRPERGMREPLTAEKHAYLEPMDCREAMASWFWTDRKRKNLRSRRPDPWPVPRKRFLGDVRREVEQLPQRASPVLSAHDREVAHDVAARRPSGARPRY
jgi:hypothetical protein